MSKKPSKTPATTAQSGKKALIGIGLDGDGHKRITQGEQFALVGGSEETHDCMTETVMKTFEELKRRDRHLDTVDPRELAEIVHKSTPR